MSKACTRLSPARLGFAFGLLGGLDLLLLGWAGWVWGFAAPFINILGSAYLGYSPTFLGGIVGGIWGFIDFFIFFWLAALIYNCTLGG